MADVQADALKAQNVEVPTDCRGESEHLQFGDKQRLYHQTLEGRALAQQHRRLDAAGPRACLADYRNIGKKPVLCCCAIPRENENSLFLVLCAHRQVSGCGGGGGATAYLLYACNIRQQLVPGGVNDGALHTAGKKH